MKGTIEIKAEGINLEIHVSMSQLKPSDRLILVDGLVRALRCGPGERMALGLAISGGGIDAVMGGRVDETLIDLSALTKQKGKQDNETDSR